MQLDVNALRGIIFDYGGTIDSRGDHWSWVIRRGYEAAGLDIPLDDFRTAYVYAERLLARERHILPQHTFADLMAIKVRIELSDLVARGIVSQADAERCAAPVADYCYRAARASVADAKAVLERLAGRYPMVLVSNFYGNVETVIRDMGIRHLFRGVIESAVVGVRKPDPTIFRLGVVALGMEPQQVLVVGDSLRKDIEPAEAIGCQTAWIKGRGWTPDEDAATHPSIIPSLDALPGLLGL